MKFAIIGEGISDYHVLKNLLYGYFNNKNLPVTQVFPEGKEPAGWGNLLNYISSVVFTKIVEDYDYSIIQIDTDRCEDWNLEIKFSFSEASDINNFVTKVQNALISKIGSEYYETVRNKIIFAISVHQIECWLLPFNTNQKAKHSKIVTCSTAIEEIANKQGFSIHQKNYQEGKNYDRLSKDMKTHRELLAKAPLNPSLNIFINALSTIFPPSVSL